MTLRAYHVVTARGSGLTVAGRTQSLRAWARETGIPHQTVCYRFRQGWPPEAIIGRAPPPSPPQTDFRALSKVLILDGRRPITRREAAARLGCKPETLAKCLRKYQVDGTQVLILLSELQRTRPPKTQPVAENLQQCYSVPMPPSTSASPSPLRRLSAALAGKPPPQELPTTPQSIVRPTPEPPEPLKPIPARVAPANPVPPPTAPPAATPVAAPSLPHPHAARYVTALIDGVEVTRSLVGWSKAMDLDRSTLAYRLNRGWQPREILGLDPPPSRNRGAEQAASAITHSRVVLVEDVGGATRVIPRAEAARRLGIQPRSLTHRLRRYRPADGSTARLSFSVLQG